MKAQANPAKEYLQRVRLYDTRIANKLAELRRLEDMVYSITSSMSPVKVTASSSQDKLGDAVAKIVDLQKEINDTVDMYVDIKKEIEEQMQKIDDPDQLAVLYKRYFELKKWSQIAEELGYAERHTTRLHGYALSNFKKIMKDVRKCP